MGASLQTQGEDDQAMPIYEYACDKCEQEFEVEQRITDDPLKSCPSCRSRKVKRLISQTSFVLKGGGWYSDLYSSGKGSEKAEKSEKSEGGTADTGSKDGGGKSESKGDAPKGSGKTDKKKGRSSKAAA